MVNIKVDYFGDFVFWFSVNDYKYWQRLKTLQKGIRYSWFKHRDIEHRVHSFHGVQKIKCKELQTRLSNYFIWSKVLFGEFFQ